MVKFRRRTKKKYIPPVSTKGLAKELLVLLAEGGAVYSLALLAGPAGAGLLARFGKKALYRIDGLLQGFEKQKLIERRRHGRQTLIKITDYGKQRAAMTALKFYKFHKMEQWDGKWRLIIFDVPEEAHSRRNFLRAEFQRFGFRTLQRSVMVSPFPCKELYEFICEASGLGRCVHLIEATTLGGLEKQMREVFCL